MASGLVTTSIRPMRRPEGFAEQHRSTQLPLEQGQVTNQVVMPSVHNWVEQVYRAFRQPFPTGANQLVLLGVREMSRDSDEGSYSRNSRPADRQRGNAKFDTTTTFDDLLFAVWTETTPEEGTKARVYPCTIDPSIEYNTTGSPYLLEGKAYKTVRGWHSKAGGGQSLHMYTGTRGNIMISREATHSSRVFREAKSAFVKDSNSDPGLWEFVAMEENPTFHIHWSSNYEDPEHHASTNWSAGCTVLAYKQNNAIWREFRRLFTDAANRDAIPYLVVSSAYVKLPEVWVASAGEGGLKEPVHTLKQSGLVSAPEPLSGYLPSTMTYRFAQDVLNIADEADRLMAAAAGAETRHTDEALANFVALHEEGGLDEVLPPGLLERWAATRGDGEVEPLSDEERAAIVEGLSGLGTSLRASIHRACFDTVIPPKRGPR